MNSIGLDVHSARFFLTAVNEDGKIIRSTDRPMSEKDLIEAVTMIPGPRQVTVEECHLAQFVKSVLERHVDRIMVCDPEFNRWIAKDDFCDDRTASKKLALLLCRDELKEISHPDDDHAELRSTFLHYFDLNTQIVRWKNKIKGVYRSVGIRTEGITVYTEAGRLSYLPRLARWPHLALEVHGHYKVLDLLSKQKRQACKRMVQLAKREPAFELLTTVPGVGQVIAAGYAAMIGSAHRFSHKNKLWKYTGFGNVLHTSDKRVYKRGCSKRGNRVLKWLVIQNFRHVLRIAAANSFNQKYRKLIETGHTSTAARRHVCRLILSVVRRVWLDNRPYEERPLTSQTSAF